MTKQETDLLGELYQLLGNIEEPPQGYTQEDIIRLMDELVEAMSEHSLD